MITEGLMRPGSGELKLRPDVPVSVTDQILEWVTGVGVEIVICDGENLPTDPALIWPAARWAGPLFTTESRLSYTLEGLSWWLSTGVYQAIDLTTGTGASPITWLNALNINGFTVAPNTPTAPNTKYKAPAFSGTYRDVLNAVAQRGGWEWSISPTGVLSAAVPRIGATNPAVIITADRTDPAAETGLRGVYGSILQQQVDASHHATRVIAIGSRDTVTGNIPQGWATKTIPLRTRTGGTPVLTRFVDAASDDADLQSLAVGALNLASIRRKIDVQTRSPQIRSWVAPGDDVYVYNEIGGLFDKSNPISWHGRTVWPMRVRLLEISWPIEAGLSVFARNNSATPEWIDLSPWVEREGPDTWWKVGDWAPDGYGVLGRSNPLLAARIGTG